MGADEDGEGLGLGEVGVGEVVGEEVGGIGETVPNKSKYLSPKKKMVQQSLS